MIIEVKGKVLPQSGLGKACTSAINQWERLVRDVEPEHGMVEIDHSWAENGMRGVALGRNHWIHIGSEGSGRCSSPDAYYNALIEIAKCNP